MTEIEWAETEPGRFEFRSGDWRLEVYEGDCGQWRWTARRSGWLTNFAYKCASAATAKQAAAAWFLGTERPVRE